MYMICSYVYVCIYIYIARERERDKHCDKHIIACTYTVMLIYMYAAERSLAAVSPQTKSAY